MVNDNRPVLRGFDTAVADVGDQLHLCHPLLSFEGESTLYVARRLDWRNDQDALAVADPSEASELGTLLPNAHRQPIVSGQAVVAAGTGFVQAATTAEIQLDGFGMDFTRLHDAECWISVTTPAHFERLKTGVADRARAVFDEALGDAARRRRRLSERGDAALLLLRRCGPRRRDDLAIRQLAGARQNDDLDLYRRLLIRFALELGTRENDLNERVGRHMALAERPRHTAPHLSIEEYPWSCKALPPKSLSVMLWEKHSNQHLSLESDNMADWLIRSWSQVRLESSDFGELEQLKIKDTNIIGLIQPNSTLPRAIRCLDNTKASVEQIAKTIEFIGLTQPNSTLPRAIHCLDNTKVSMGRTEKTVELLKILSVAGKDVMDTAEDRRAWI